MRILLDENLDWRLQRALPVKPKKNAAFWLEQPGKIQARDRLVTRTLRAQGWKVVRIWEHELTRKNQPRLLKRLEQLIPPSLDQPA